MLDSASGLSVQSITDESMGLLLRSRLMIRLIAALLLVSCLPVFAGPVFKDDFSNPKLAERKAARGPWKFANGIATCTQDDELFRKFKDHGPIIFYDVPHQNAKIRFAFKAEACRTVVFTANGEKGHVFRFVASAAGTSIRAFPPGDEHKSVELAKGPALKLGEWVEVAVELNGSKAVVSIGKDFTQTVESPHLAAAKANISVGFSFGTLSVRDVVIEQ